MTTYLLLVQTVPHIIEMHIIFCLLILLNAQATWQQAVDSIYLEVSNKEILTNQDHSIIMTASNLNHYYNDTIFLTEFNCRNDNLEVINNTGGTQLVLTYSNIPSLSYQNAGIEVYPNQQPKSTISYINETSIIIDFNCPDNYSSRNYFNQITFTVNHRKLFSFLLNCDPDSRHKQFQFGYIIISLINAAIIAGVAMHSHIWSIKINLRPLRYQLKWIPFLIFSVIGSIVIIVLTTFSINDKAIAFLALRYTGIVISCFFVFICYNQIFYLVKKMRTPLYRSIRICDLISAILTIVMTVLAFLYQNWIFYSFIAGCICVGSIKIFHFNSLKQALVSMLILVTNTTTLAIILHFLLPLSYNDYAGQLSSPLFFEVPDLVNNLYKKCSWLPIIDVIIPGVMLSYLRVYDENRSSRWGGVYTISGNIIFVIGTAIWVGLESVYPFSIPFSLITYPILAFSIFIISWRRNDWDTLFYGRFQQGYDTINANSLKQNRSSFGQHVSEDTLSGLLINQTDKNPNSSSILTT